MKKQSSILVFVLFVLLSCETVVKIDLPDNEPKLVLNSFINSDSSVVASLHLSETVLDDYEFETVPEASIRILDENDVVVSELQYDSLGLYSSDFMPLPGVTYRMEAEKEGYNSIFGVTRIPENTLDNISITSRPLEEVPEDSAIYVYSLRYEITVTIEDKADEENFYELELFEQGTYVDSWEGEEYRQPFRNSLYLNSEDPVFDDFNTDGISLFFNDALFNGSTAQIQVEVYISEPYCRSYCEDYEVFMNLRTVSESYFNYKRTLRLQRNLDGDPFAEPVTVYNNINNGFGVFAGYRNNIYQIEY